jgi:6-phosphogluconate dehydrogenase
LADGDIIIDGGNSYYRDDIARANALKPSGIHYVDCGTSGGVFGLDRGFCLMIGGEEAIIQYLDPIFKSIAVQAVRGILSRWYITASSTASWPPMPKG